MSPRNKQKSPKVRKEDAERRKKILSTKEKILSIKRMILSIIEVMIEKEVSEEWFLANSAKLCHADYNDVVQERSIEHVCGYPLCSNTIKQTLKQKYHISQVANKVYDLTERKCFCSNQCYKASNYLKAQLSPIPLYMRREEKIKVHLLSDCNNRGSAGEEIVFHHTISQDEIETVANEQISTNFSDMLKEEMKKCADSLSELQIKENVFEKQFVFGDETPKKSEDPVCGDNEFHSGSDVETDSEDENIFPSYDNVAVSSHKQMPIPRNIKKAVLISPLKPDTTVSSPVEEAPLEFVINLFKDWITEDTMKYLLGEKYVYGIKADHLFEQMTTNEPIDPEKLSSIKDEYIKLSLKIDKLPDDDDDGDDDDDDFEKFAEIDVLCESLSKTNSVSKTIEAGDSTSKKVFKRRSNRKSKEIRKQVTFAPEVKPPAEERKKEEVENDISSVQGKASEELSAPSSSYQSAFPLVDSICQNALRRQVIISNLKAIYFELLPAAGLHYTDIREALRKFVETLSLTPSNTIFKPKEGKLIALVLFKILTKTVVKDLYNEKTFLKMCEHPFIPISIDILKIEKIVSDLLCSEYIINLQ